MQLSTRNSIQLQWAAFPWTVQVTNGLNRVISSADADWSQVTLQSFFGKDASGAPLYLSIVDIQKPAAATSIGYPPAANSASGRWEIFLAVPYAQPDDAAMAYYIHKDFFPNGTPAWAPGDTQFVPIQNRTNAIIDSLVGSGAGAGSIGNRQFDSTSDLEAASVIDLGLSIGDLLFVTHDDSTSIYQYQTGAPAGGDHPVAGSSTTRYRQTGGG